jgi:hypothetical protein
VTFFFFSAEALKSEGLQQLLQPVPHPGLLLWMERISWNKA